MYSNWCWLEVEYLTFRHKGQIFYVFAFFHKVTGKGKLGKMLTQISFIHCLEAPAVNSYTFFETFQPLRNLALLTAIYTNQTVSFCLIYWYLNYSLLFMGGIDSALKYSWKNYLHTWNFWVNSYRNLLADKHVNQCHAVKTNKQTNKTLTQISNNLPPKKRHLYIVLISSLVFAMISIKYKKVMTIKTKKIL